MGSSLYRPVVKSSGARRGRPVDRAWEGHSARRRHLSTAGEPLLANLFLHYAFDRWMRSRYPQLPFERYADDAIVHCRTEAEAQEVRTAIAARNGGMPVGAFINFSPAISDEAGKSIRTEIRSWNLHLRSDKAIENLSRMFNPIIRGWLECYGQYYRSALYPYMRQLDRSPARWANRKYKKLRGHLRRATHWIARISRRDSKLFARWQMGVRRGSMAGAV